MDWDNNCYFLSTLEAVASVLEIPYESSPSAFLSPFTFWERFVTLPSASAPTCIYFIRLSIFSLIHTNRSLSGANLFTNGLKTFQNNLLCLWKAGFLNICWQKNVGRRLGRHRGTWALEKTDLGVNHRGLLLTLPVSPRISSLTSVCHFLTCTMGIILKAKVVVKGNEKVCVCSTSHSDSTVNNRHYSRQSRSRARVLFWN